jgi:hypothetical protein
MVKLGCEVSDASETPASNSCRAASEEWDVAALERTMGFHEKAPKDQGQRGGLAVLVPALFPYALLSPLRRVQTGVHQAGLLQFSYRGRASETIVRSQPCNTA